MEKNMSEYYTEKKNKDFKDLIEKGENKNTIKLNKFLKFDKENNSNKKEAT